MLERLPQLGPHEAQIALTVTLLVATAIIALLCDVLRFRARVARTAEAGVKAPGSLSEAAPALRTSLSKTLVPEVAAAQVPAKVSTRASRLAAALKQPRRVLSPAAQAVIERGVMAAQSAPAPAVQPTPAAQPAPAAQSVPVMSSAPPAPAFPTGLQSPGTLSRLVASGERVTGLVVAAFLTGGEVPAPVFNAKIAGLLEEGEFASPVNSDGFVLIARDAQGPAAKRRMRAISQRLWDIQVELLAQYGASFQWGGIDVQNELIADAVRGAMEHREAPGERKMPASEKSKAFQQAV